MNMRGKWAERPDGFKVINVTSAQGKNSIFRRDFSPMTLRDYKGYCSFENYWQGGKVMEFYSDEYRNQWKKLTKSQRKLKNSKKYGKVLYAIYEDGVKRDYIDARKNIYVKNYYELIKDTESIKKIKKEYDKVVIFDFDGPRDNNNNPICEKVDLKYLKKKIEDKRHQFGHGYIVALTLLGFKLEDLIN